MSDWREDLGRFMEQGDKARKQERRTDLEIFIAEKVVPALEQVAAEIDKHGRRATLRSSATSAALTVTRAGEEEMTYRVMGRTLPNGVLPCAEVRFRQRKGLRFITVESMFRSGAQDYTLADVTPDEIVRDFVQNYTSRVQSD
ncbi:MAG: hypothetical protein FJ225_06505 [Lentisphaerae bacterium]|nr:hypothetical protein [Lentisphaerota bacterium]